MSHTSSLSTSVDKATGSSIGRAHLLSPSKLVRPYVISPGNESDANSLPPVHCLPNEILGDIFTLVPTRDEIECIPNALAVSSVCRRWRGVALSRSSLWNTIIFGPKASKKFHELCHSRSGERELHITTVIHGVASIDKANFDSASRRQSWVLKVPDALCAVQAFSSYSSFLAGHSGPSLLQVLSLEGPPDSSRPITIMNTINLSTELIGLVHIAPLQHLSFRSAQPCLEPIIYAQLTTLVLENLRPVGPSTSMPWGPILYAATQLRTLIIRHVASSNWVGSPAPDRAYLPHLERLCVEAVSGADRVYIFARLVSPALRRLTIGLGSGAILREPEVVKFIQNTPSIRHLRLSSDPHHVFLRETLPALIQLEVLAIGDKQYNAIFPNLRFLGDIPIDACPKLASLHIQLFDTPFPLTPIQDFILRRAQAPGVTPIRSVSFDCLHNHTSIIQQELDKRWFMEHVELGRWRCQEETGEISLSDFQKAKDICRYSQQAVHRPR